MARRRVGKTADSNRWPGFRIDLDPGQVPYRSCTQNVERQHERYPFEKDINPIIQFALIITRSLTAYERGYR